MKILLFAIRSLMRFRLYTAINILGLALSLACVIIISRYVYSEATTDHFNKIMSSCISVCAIGKTEIRLPSCSRPTMSF